MRAFDQSHMTAVLAIAGGVILGAALVRPVASSLTSDVRLQGLVVVGVGLMLSSVDGRFIKFAGLGMAGQGALQTIAGLGVAIPTS